MKEVEEYLAKKSLERKNIKNTDDSNPFSKFVDKQDKTPTPLIHKKNPDEYAKTLEMASKTGLDTDIIERNKEDVMQKIERDDFNKQLEGSDNNSVVREVLQDYDTGVLAKDDIDNMQKTEGVFGGVFSYFKHRKENYEKVKSEGRRADAKVADKLYPAVKPYLPHFADVMVTNYREGKRNTVIDSLEYKEFNGTITEEETEELHELNEKELEVVESNNWFESLLGASSGQGYNLLEMSGSAIKGAGEGYLSKGVLKKIHPILGAKAIGFGATAEVFRYNYKQGVGSFYREMKNETDENGNKLDSRTLKFMSMTYGILSAGLESIGFDSLAKTIPAVKELKGKVAKNGIKKIFKNKSVMSALTKFAKNYGGAVGTEGLTEMAQEGISMIVESIGKEYENIIKDKNFKHLTQEEIEKRLINAGIEGAKATVLLGLPGTSITLRSDLKTEKNKLKLI